MSLSHTPLEISQLSAEVQRTLGSPATRMMAARGMAPLSSPRDLATVLYQLGVDGDATVRDAARGSARDLPDKVLASALGDVGLDPRVLDYFAREVKARPGLIQIILLNQSTADLTVAWLAGVVAEAEADLIAQNEQRLLRLPEIIGALYGNRRARMSTIDRVVELAVHNDVKVPGVAAWDEICRSILQSGRDEREAKLTDAQKDAMFSTAARVHADRDDADDAAVEREAEKPTEEAKISIRDMTVPMKIRLATLGNKFDRSMLVRDSKKLVAMAAIKAPGITENEAAKFATNTALVEDVIAYIASRRDWVKQYNVKLALVQNPKCPLPVAMRLMTHLREKDIRNISRSKGIPSALSAQARKLQNARSGGK